MSSSSSSATAAAAASSSCSSSAGGGHPQRQQQLHAPPLPAVPTTRVATSQQKRRVGKGNMNASSRDGQHQQVPSSTARIFRLPGGLRFRFPARARLADAMADGFGWLVEMLVYAIGPVLIVLALGIVSLLTYAFATILLPMTVEKLKYAQPTSASDNNNSNAAAVAVAAVVVGHCSVVAFLVFNVLYNFYYCVRTKHSGPHYDDVVRELAEATNFALPTDPREIENWRREYEELMILRMRRRQAREVERHRGMDSSTNSASTATTVTHRGGATSAAVTANGSSGGGAEQQQQRAPAPPPRRWMLMGPFEWGFCGNSNLPKPPRSHYDHVTKQLVLNLDHYCPWMFNSIGYFNYRYFCNFLLYIFLGMLYGSLISFEPFMLLSSPDYQRQWGEQQRVARERGVRMGSKEYAEVAATMQRVRPMVPFRHERTLLTLSFMLCTAVGFAVLILGGFHLYLALTAQTTIEFHANYASRRRAKREGHKWQNPYDQGWKKNWQQVYGVDRNWLVALLPSSRQPDVLPVPVPGHSGLRRRRIHETNQIKNKSRVNEQQDPLLGVPMKGDELA